MELQNENINLDIKRPEEYINKIHELNGAINLLLDQFKEVFVMSRMYPSNEEIQQRFQNMTDSIEEIQSKTFSLSNNVQADLNKINEVLIRLDLLIKHEKDKNNELKEKLGIIESSNNSASEMITDYKQIYNIKYLRNWGIVLSTLLCLVTISIVFKRQGV